MRDDTLFCPYIHACIMLDISPVGKRVYTTVIVLFTDIDECMEGDADCNQICVNTLGSYYCSCEPGYQLVNDTECEGINSYYIYVLVRN